MDAENVKTRDWPPGSFWKFFLIQLSLSKPKEKWGENHLEGTQVSKDKLPGVFLRGYFTPKKNQQVVRSI